MNGIGMGSNQPLFPKITLPKIAGDAGRILYLTLGMLIGMFGGYFLSLSQVETLIAHDRIMREIKEIEDKKGVKCQMLNGEFQCIVYTIPEVTS